MEIWDGYNADGTLAGVDLIRGEEIPKGLYHLVCEILVRHVDGDYLLMQRDFNKEGYPGYFEATAGGSALKGEDKLACAKRELFEETGIASEDFEEIGRSMSHNTIYYVFFSVTDCDKDTITLQEGETVSFKWVCEKDFVDFVNSEEMIDVQRKRLDDFLRKMGYVKEN